MPTEKLFHCQICERDIKAGNGRIAHHGYQRPGGGWQTASCFGARYRPYETACDALAPYIEMLEAYIVKRKYEIARLTIATQVVNPRFQSRYISFSAPRINQSSPVKFLTAEYGSKFEEARTSAINHEKQQISNAKAEIERAAKRRTAWYVLQESKGTKTA